MPPRRKPTSTRQKKADQQLKRAIKRGDVEAPDPKKPAHNRKRRTGPTGRPIAGASDNAAVIESARRLQSAFVKVSDKFLEDTKSLASNISLVRPVPDEKAVFHHFAQAGEDGLDVLTCPRRPKWRYDQTKKEVEKNEEGIFKKWLQQTDDAIEKWQDQPVPAGSSMPRSASYFERNLEVWRQLWRVTEISQIILVLLDSRCPLLHYPPSLATYLQDRKVILVLTKVDISGSARVAAWIEYIHQHHPNSRIVQVESYIERVGVADQGHTLYEPHLPPQFRERLVNEIREVHAELLEPPERVKSNPDRLKHWVPPVKKDVDWEAVLSAKGEKVGLAVGGATVPRAKTPDDEERNYDGSGEAFQEPTHLTVGLIGQPNVGKSSLLNALFGARKVRASKTPGKTKHFQTLFWTNDVRLVDCPGLVMPNYVPMEMQVLSGILPISRVSAVPACIYHASELLPLERIYNLDHPNAKLPPVEDKRTWRDETKAPQTSKESASLAWTAMDILTAYADSKGWVTAKAGRPDVHRAGNAILRALAEGRIGWAFWPPETLSKELSMNSSPEQGLWIPRGDKIEEDDHRDEDGADLSDSESDDPKSTRKRADSASEEGDSEADDEEDEEEDDDTGPGETTVKSTAGRFGALAIGSGDDESEEESS
ncbi:hypothetical protein CPB83DRAFT_779796 [Crepidotus variabilis]|uniref:Guanine nucleotide-binding protein-like 1 n=1 Tax=Crepidotus variabilis TaxID=179855 RepID=A0A9P6ET32_9AGAR|nr:hypothetical protein CPB83DRAFT_779796 [Crepidotus variabilis]